MKTSRRQFLSAALVGLVPKGERRVAGSFVDDSHTLGHRLRDRAAFGRPAQQVKVPVVIVGGGVAGLSAAWRLEKRGFRDFVLLEMERRAGGNARWDENEISAYPWGAHYVPVPDKNAALVRELFEELGVLKDGVWEERYLCHTPKERLFLHGRWQEGVEPHVAGTRKDHENFRRFAEVMGEFHATGRFTIPMERGARASDLDRITMAQWLSDEGFDSPYLKWYVDYACRDDYGALAADVSAWAGVHYFASRDPEEPGPLTWPEGNGWIVRKLLAKLGRYVRAGSMVHRIRPEGRRWRVETEQTAYLAEAVIFAAPTFLAAYLVEGVPPMRGLVYSPWLTANLTLDRLPRERNSEPAWDNVIYDSPALGYVDATHQSLRSHVDRSVWTYYWALAEGAPAANRRLLLEKDWNYWKEAILNDLAKAHPDIRACVARVDILRLGHAMVRPSVGFVFSEERRRMGEARGTLFFGNSDLSGFSLFEEAQYRGVRAAEGVLGVVGS